MKCAAMTRYALNGMLLPAPRPCVKNAKAGSTYCGYHAYERTKKIILTASDGGFCVWCGEPGRRYACPNEVVEIVLCQKHGAALFRALEPTARKKKVTRDVA